MKYFRVILSAIIVVLGIVAIYYIKTYSWLNVTILLLQENIWYVLYAVGTISLMYPLWIWSQRWEKYVLYWLIISHIIILAIYFLMMQLWLSLFLAGGIVILFMLLILAINIRHAIRLVAIVPLSITCVASVLLATMPQYQAIPTEQDFYDNIGINIYVVVNDVPVTLREVQANITVESIYTGREIKIPISESSPQYDVYPIKRPTTIYFDSSQALYNTLAFVQFYDGQVYPVPTQSSLSIQYINTWYGVGVTGLNQDDIINNAKGFINTQTDRITQNYYSQRKDFFINRVGWQWTQIPYVDKGIGYILSSLSRLLPEYYDKNYQNYIAFKALIWEDVTEKTDMVMQTQNISFRESILPGIKRSRIFRWIIWE